MLHASNEGGYFSSFRQLTKLENINTEPFLYHSVQQDLFLNADGLLDNAPRLLIIYIFLKKRTALKAFVAIQQISSWILFFFHFRDCLHMYGRRLIEIN